MFDPVKRPKLIDRLARMSRGRANRPQSIRRQYRRMELDFHPTRREFTNWERAAKEVPEMRQERVQSLKTAIQEGRYQPPPEQVAEAMFSDAIARVDLLRR